MGRVFRPKYAWTKTDGTRIEKVTEAWYIEYADSNGRWVRRKAGVTKQQAQDALRQAEADVLSAKNGLPTQQAATISCDDLCKRYLAVLKPRVSARHYQVAAHQLKKILNTLRTYSVRDLTHECVERYLIELDAEGLAPKTINGYLSALKAMLNWAVRARIILYNPLTSVPKRSEEQKRHARHALSEEELNRLLAAGRAGPLRRNDRAYKGGPVPEDVRTALLALAERNVLIYKLLVMTGLRVNEARLLRWADVDLEGGLLTTRPWWTGNKNGKEEVLPLAPRLVEDLRSWSKQQSHDLSSPVVRIPKQFLRTLGDDLVAAGLARRVPLDGEGEEIPLGLDGKPVRKPAEWTIDKRDAAGRIIDLHALRHTYGTRLVASGADIKTTQALMRHSTPSLTLAIYVHQDTRRMAAAVAAMPELPPLTDDRAVAGA